jgi:RNA polymerase sigma-70 factor (ECF subfamily)
MAWHWQNGPPLGNSRVAPVTQHLPNMNRRRDELIPTRASLLVRLKDWQDNSSWQDFFDTYWRLIYGIARRAGLSDAEAQDVVQEAIISVAKKMHEFKYDPAAGSFKSWLLLITQRRIADHLRKRYRQVQVAERSARNHTETATVERVADPAGSIALETIWNEEWEKNLMDAALQRVKVRINAKQYQSFDFYVVKKWPVSKVAKALGVSVAQVYVAKHRVGRLVKKELDELKKKML